MLSSGIAPNTRYEVRSINYAHQFDLGITRRTGRERKGLTKPHLYWGACSSIALEQERWNSDVTTLATNEVRHTSGTVQNWSYAFAPLIGFRGAEKQGRLFTEVRTMALKELQHPGSGWQLRSMLTFGYRWVLGGS
jgi:hypothetical protein